MIPRKIPFILLLTVLTLSCGAVSKMLDKSGTLLTIEVKADGPDAEQTTVNAVNILKNRLNAFGIDGEVSKTAPTRLEVKIYGATDLEKVKPNLLATSKFELRKVVSPPNPAPVQSFPSEAAAIQSLGGQIPANRKVLAYSGRADAKSKLWIIVEDPPIIDGNELRDARAYAPTGLEKNYQISFSLNPAGAQKFGQWTSVNINNYLAVILNDEVKSAVFIKSQIFDSGVINGNFDQQEAEDLALILKSGYLPATLTLVDEKTSGK